MEGRFTQTFSSRFLPLTAPKLNPTVYGPRRASPRPRRTTLSLPSDLPIPRFVQFARGEGVPKNQQVLVTRTRTGRIKTRLQTRLSITGE